MADWLQPLLQTSIDLCNTITPNKFHIEKNAHILMSEWPHSPPPIEHRSLQHHYTQPVSHIEECTYTHDRMDHTPPPIEHRYMQHHYTHIIFTYRKMHIYPWADGPPNWPYISATPLHLHKFHIYRRMHISPWQMDTHLQMRIDPYNTITPNKCHI